MTLSSETQTVELTLSLGHPRSFQVRSGSGDSSPWRSAPPSLVTHARPVSLPAWPEETGVTPQPLTVITLLCARETPGRAAQG